MDTMLVECSDPGTIVTQEEDLENVLRHVTFDVAVALKGRLTELAAEMGDEVATAWRPFRIETPNECGTRPLTFGTREDVEQAPLARLASEAAERGLGRFRVGGTILLNQSHPNPETREQFVEDLADCVDHGDAPDLPVRCYPVPPPDAIKRCRQRFVEETAGEALSAAAGASSVGHRWLRDTSDRVKKAIEDAQVRSEAVMVYELGRLSPEGMERAELRQWACLAVRLGCDVAKWCDPLLSSVDFVHVRAATLVTLWRECNGFGTARSFLDTEMEETLKVAREAYSADGLAAIRLLFQRLRTPWQGDLAGD